MKPPDLHYVGPTTPAGLPTTFDLVTVMRAFAGKEIEITVRAVGEEQKDLTIERSETK